MSNVVKLLEQMGATTAAAANLRLATAIADELDPAVVQALLARDAAALRAALGMDATVTCFVVPAENEPEDEPADSDPATDTPVESEPNSIEKAA